MAQTKDETPSRYELLAEENATYHKMSIARAAYEDAMAEYVRAADRLNDYKIRESRDPH